MSKLKVLLKYSWLKFIGTFQGKKQRKSSTISSVLVILLGLGILALYTLQAYGMYNGLAPLGLAKICMFHCSLITLCVILILGFMRSAGKKKQADDDILLSLPLKKSEIILTKCVSTYLFDLAFTFILLFPFVLLYMIFTGFNLGLLLVTILMLFLLPLVSVGLTNIISFIISNVFNKSKYSSFYKSILSAVFLIAILFLIFIKTIGYGAIEPSNINAYFNDRFITNLLTKALLYQDLVSILIIAGICIVTFLLGLLLAIKNFGKSETGYHSKSEELVFPKKHTLFGSLLKKEIKNYLTTPVFFTNTIMAPLIILISSIMFTSLGVEGINSKLGLELNSTMLSGILVVAYLFSLSMATISCCTISLEGKNFWIIKCCPISLNKLFLSKSLLQIIFTVPVIVVGSVICLIFLHFQFFEFLMLLLIPIIYAVASAFGGVFINILFPKFEYDDETKVVKQSVSPLINMLGGVIFAVIPVLFAVLTSLSITYIALIVGLIYIVALIIIVTLLFTVGKNKFKKL